MFTTFLLLFFLTALFIIVGRFIAGKRGMIIAFVLACVLNFSAYWFSDTLVLSAYNAKPVPQGHRLERITHDLALKAGLPVPKAYVIDSDSPNAFATGRNPDHAAVAATRGILNLMDDSELSAVMAHELGHVKNRDTLVATMAASISGGVLILPGWRSFSGETAAPASASASPCRSWRRWRRPSSPWPSRGIGNTVRTSIRPGSRNVRSSSRMRSSS